MLQLINVVGYQVLATRNDTIISVGNICRRWTVSARLLDATLRSGASQLDANLLGKSARKNMLFIATMDLLKSGEISVAAFEVAMRSIEEARSTLRMLRDLLEENDINTMDLNSSEEMFQISIAVKAKGRPPSVRIKSRSETYGNKNAKSLPRTKQSVQEPVEDIEAIEMITDYRTTKKREVKCSTCGVPGHNRATCGRKRSRG